jgi:hypothetical protein
MTSAVGPADVIVDRSTLTGQRSTVKAGQRSMVSGQWSAGPTGQPQPEADGWAPRVSRVKEKDHGSVSGPKGSGPARGPAKRVVRLGVQLGLRLSRPARAGGLREREARLGLSWLGSLRGPAFFLPRAGPPLLPLFPSGWAAPSSSSSRGPAASFPFFL